MKKGYVSAEDLWLFIDEYMQRLEMQNEQAVAYKSESYKLIVCGRMEAMNAVGDWLHENEVSPERMKEIFAEWEPAE
jgi:hypothetical protein